MKILIWGDPHIYPNSAFSRPTEDGLTTYLQEILQTGEWLKNLVHEYRPQLSVCLGDVFHTHDHVDAQSLHVAEKFLEEHIQACESVKSKFELVLGNHEIYSSKIHLLPFVRQHVNGSPQSHLLFVPGSNEEWLGFLPYGSDLSDLPTGGANSKTITIWFGHLEIKGAHRQAGSLETKGVTLDQFPENSIVFNGHYHRPHAIAGPNGTQAVFPGSVTARTFSDSAAPLPRGALLFDTVTREIQRIENPHCQIFETIHVHSKAEIDKLQLIKSRDRTNVRVYLHDPGLEKDKGLRSQMTKFAHASVVPAPNEVEGDQNIVLELDTAVEANLVRYLETEVELPDGIDQETILRSCREVIAQAGDSERTRCKSVRFRTLRATNFMSFRSLEVDFTTPGLTLVEGQNLDDSGAQSNGSGKSAIFEALFWVLFDKTLRGTRKSEVGFLNGKKKGDPCSVELELEFNEQGRDVVVFRIHRYRDQPKVGTGLEIEAVDGESSMTPRLATDAQKVIDELLGLTPDLAQHLFFLTQGLSHRFMELGDADRKRLVESILGIDIYEAIYSASLGGARDAKAQVESREYDLRVSASNVEGIAGRLENAEADLEQFDANQKEDMARNQVTISSVQEGLKTLEQDREGAEKSIAELKTRQADLDGSYTRLVNDYNEITNSLVGLQTQLSGHQRQQSDAQKLLDEGNCPTCGQSLEGAEHLHQAVAADTSELQAEIADWTQTRQGVQSEKEGIHLALTSIQESLEHWRESLRGTERSISSNETAINNAKNIIAQYEALREEKSKRVEQEQKALNNAREGVLSTEEKLEGAQRELLLRQTVSSLFSPTGMRAMILRSAVDWLNRKLDGYSEILLGDDRVVIESSTELKSGKSVDKFSVAIHGSRSYTSCSSGERRRGDLVIQFGLNSLAQATTGLRTNVLICDEIDDKLDMTGMENLATLLRKKAEEDNLAVYLVTQHSFLKGLIPQRWTVRKEKGVSTL